MLNKQTYWVLLITLWYSLSLQAQNYSADVSLVQQDGQSVTLRATAIADKKKEAADLAARSAFHALLHTGIEGVRNGMPMIAVERNDYDYRFFTELRYLNYIRGEVEDVSDSKIGGKRRVSQSRLDGYEKGSGNGRPESHHCGGALRQRWRRLRRDAHVGGE